MSFPESSVVSDGIVIATSPAMSEQWETTDISKLIVAAA